MVPRFVGGFYGKPTDFRTGAAIGSCPQHLGQQLCAQTNAQHWPTGRNEVLQQAFLGAQLLQAGDERPGVHEILTRRTPLAGGEPVWRTIVGVVGNVRHAGLDVPVAPRVYLPYAQDPIASMAIAIRTAGDPLSVVDSLRRAVASVDPELPIAEARTMERVVAESAASRRFTNFVLVTFALIAVVLAAVGIYGVISYSVSQRTHEFGLRMALGAQPSELLTLVIRQGLVTTVVGLVIGLVGALGAGRLAAGLLFEISPHDPLVLIGVAAILVLVAFVACWIPAYRASRLEPMAALRYQ